MSLLSGIRYGGIPYFKNLIPALAEVDKNNEYHIFIQEDNPLLHSINEDNFFFHVCHFNTRVAFVRHSWEQFILPKEVKKSKIDILFTAKNTNIFLAQCKTIISIRNMEPLCYKNYRNHWQLNFFSWIRRCLTNASIKKADRVIAVSRFARDYLGRNFEGILNKVDIAYNGNSITNGIIGETHNNTSNVKIDIPFFISSSKFVVYANQLNLLKGYALLYKKNRKLPPIYFAGHVHDKVYYNEINKFIDVNGISHKVKFLGYLSHEDLIRLYCKAFAFIFPSTLEACPQTLIEVMACGVPIATSNIPPMPEMCEDAAVYFDPFDERDIAEKIELLLNDEKHRYNLKKASLERCKFFDWKKTALEIVESFEKCYINSV